MAGENECPEGQKLGPGPSIPSSGRASAPETGGWGGAGVTKDSIVLFGSLEHHLYPVGALYVLG